MPLIRCPHCGEDTPTIAGWVDLDYCASCGNSLGGRPLELDAARKARRRLQRSAEPATHALARPVPRGSER